MLLKHVLFLLILSILSSMILTGGSLLYTQTIEMIDFAATRYGFPYWWFEHVYVTFAGRTDIWRFETSNLVKDMVLFFLLSLGFWFIIPLSKQRMAPRTRMKIKRSS